MAIGERIKFIRLLRRMTQKQLGIASGFDEKTADIRIAQYESGVRSPKDDYTKAIALALDVDELALNVPDIDSPAGVLHTLFALEDLYNFQIDFDKQGAFIRLDDEKFDGILKEWYKQSEKRRLGEITEMQYNDWRYGFTPEKPEANPEQKPEQEPPVPMQEIAEQNSNSSTSITYELPIALL